MKLAILFFVIGFLTSSVLSDAGSYIVTLSTSPDTDDLIPKIVSYNNVRNGTNFTTLQYAQSVCNKAFQNNTMQILKDMAP